MTSIEYTRGNPIRQAKLNSHPIVEVSDEEETVADNEGAVKPTDSSVKKIVVVPIVTQNAKEFDLNHMKQFEKLSEYCKREVVKVHDPNTGEGDKGSKDRGVVYLAFNGGMFQALKSHMMRIAKEKFGVTLVKDPKVEMYGCAEERMCLDLKMKMAGTEYKVKMLVFNTACAMNFAALGHVAGKKFVDLENKTVAEAFVDLVVLNIVKDLEQSLNIEKINEDIAELASKAKETERNISGKCSKKGCKKEGKKSPMVECGYCDNTVHKTCTPKVTNALAKLDDLVYRCDECVLKQNRVKKSVPESLEQKITRLFILHHEGEGGESPAECEVCGDPFRSLEILAEHRRIIHQSMQFFCYECDEQFSNELDATSHKSSVHKSSEVVQNHGNSIETSSMSPVKETLCNLVDCVNKSEENNTLLNDIASLKDNLSKLQIEVLENNKQNKTKDEKIHLLQEEVKILENNLSSSLRAVEEKETEIQRLKASQTASNQTELEENLRKTQEDCEEATRIVSERDKVIEKMEKKHQKEMDELLKAKMNAEDDLRTTSLANNRANSEKTVFVKLLATVQELLDKKTSDDNNVATPDHQIAPREASDNGTKPKEYICEKCPYKSAFVLQLREHIDKHHIPTLYPCIICDLQATSNEELKEHMKELHDDNGQALHSRFITVTKKNAKKHKALSHDTEKYHRCPRCDYEVDDKESLEKHLRRDHKDETFICELCSYESTSDLTINEHMDRIHKWKNFNCNMCHQDLGSWSQLYLHRQTHVTSRVPRHDQNKDIFRCDECDYEVNSKSTLKNHKYKDHIEAMMTCELCDYTCSSDSSMNEHVDKDHNCKKFYCQQCCQVFSSWSMLKLHRKTHSNNFPCNDCNFKARSLKNLDEHISTQHKRNLNKKSYSEREKRKENGPCFYWNEGYCRYEDSCNYEHVEVCSFMENCKFQDKCWYVHLPYGNRHFLLGKNMGVRYRKKDLPTSNLRK